MSTTLNQWQAAQAAEGLDGIHGSICDPTPIRNMELVEYLESNGWLQGQQDGPVQTWHLGVAPIHMQVRRDEAGLIEAIRLSDETGEADATAVYINEFELGHQMREMAGPWGPAEVELYLSPVYREMTGQDGQADSLR